MFQETSPASPDRCYLKTNRVKGGLGGGRAALPVQKGGKNNLCTEEVDRSSPDSSSLREG